MPLLRQHVPKSFIPYLLVTTITCFTFQYYRIADQCDVTTTVYRTSCIILVVKAYRILISLSSAWSGFVTVFLCILLPRASSVSQRPLLQKWSTRWYTAVPYLWTQDSSKAGGKEAHLGGFVEETRSAATVQEVVVLLYVTVRESLGQIKAKNKRGKNPHREIVIG